MDDLLNSIQNILNTPEGQQQLNELSKIFNEQNSSDEGSSDNNCQNDNSDNSSDTFDFSGIDLNMIMRLGEIMESLNQEDKNTKLLLALKPHFKENKQDKIDKAIKILKLISLLPILKDSGILGGLFSDESK